MSDTNRQNSPVLTNIFINQPEVDAGRYLVTKIDTAIQLNGIVTDDGQPGPLLVSWEDLEKMQKELEILPDRE